jgi:hypothetical protein
MGTRRSAWHRSSTPLPRGIAEFVGVDLAACVCYYVDRESYPLPEMVLLRASDCPANTGNFDGGFQVHNEYVGPQGQPCWCDRSDHIVIFVALNSESNPASRRSSAASRLGWARVQLRRQLVVAPLVDSGGPGDFGGLRTDRS